MQVLNYAIETQPMVPRGHPSSSGSGRLNQQGEADCDPETTIQLPQQHWGEEGSEDVKGGCDGHDRRSQ